MSRAYLYLLALSGPEDLLKIGLTRDPLARWSAFHPRWFEEFDLERSQLVETETRSEAQALETRLHRSLRMHACPMPLTLRRAAGGETEWYRGADAPAQAFIRALAEQGFTVHAEARTVITAKMHAAREGLHALLQHAYTLHLDGMLGDDTRTSMRNWLDAHRAFGTQIEDFVPSEYIDALRFDT